MRGLLKGTTFEIELSIVLSQLERVAMVPNIQVYSHYLKRVTEIDRLMLSPFGLFCIEAKSFGTALHGTLSDEWWVGATGRTSTKIYNPVKQNFQHIRALNNALRRHLGCFLPLENIVIVPDTCRIDSNCNQVMNLSNFRNFLIRRSFVAPPVDLDFSQVATAINKVRVK